MTHTNGQLPGVFRVAGGDDTSVDSEDVSRRKTPGFVARYYQLGRFAADATKKHVPRAIAIAALCAAGFIEAAATSLLLAAVGLCVASAGFGVAMFASWKQRGANEKAA